MELRNIKIQFIETNGFSPNGKIQHTKSLPFFSIAFPYQGNYRISIGEDCALIDEMECFLAPSNITQKIDHLPDKDYKNSYRWLFFDAVINDQFSLDDLYDFPLHLDRQTSSYIIKKIEEIASYPKNTITGLVKRNIAVLDIIHYLLPLGKEKNENARLLNPALRYIKIHYNEKIDLNNLAKQCGLSRTAFYKKFKDYTNNNPFHLILNFRLQNSIEMLRKDIPISEIAESCGFSDRFHYSKTFKKIYGITPIQYKKLSPDQK